MHCKHCNYALWNIAPGPCPECGEEFRPSDFELNPNACQFICPHPGCRQDYYGTDARGHLVPPAFVCVKCHQFVEMDKMLVLPTRGVDERLTRQHRNPWSERRDRGVLKAFFATFGLAISNPRGLSRAVAEQPPRPVESVLFAAITCGLIGVTGYGVIGFVMVPALTVGRLGKQAGGQDWLETGGWVALWLIVPGVALLVLLLVWSVVTQTCLRVLGLVFGGRDHVSPPIGRTIELVCYASPALLLTALPCMGAYLLPLAAIWTWIAAGFMIAEHTQGQLARSLFALLGFPLLIVGVIAVFIAVARTF
jgi:hypothetical protein